MPSTWINEVLPKRKSSKFCSKIPRLCFDLWIWKILVVLVQFLCLSGEFHFNNLFRDLFVACAQFRAKDPSLSFVR